ncbi:hypothetical protein Leryth_023828 [Lithospermum erythrorhizon]|nr:hypothetical protein Leryth_023828 [Lithospermum erythrorhizon]
MSMVLSEASSLLTEKRNTHWEHYNIRNCSAIACSFFPKDRLLPFIFLRCSYPTFHIWSDIFSVVYCCRFRSYYSGSSCSHFSLIWLLTYLKMSQEFLFQKETDKYK